ncbi:MAG: hypothetical protein DMG96_25655 [Acidobacteria bacterium]|nr:MAG: hypothetical protein DMG96_25655 [Acidobacteriota bacterium]
MALQISGSVSLHKSKSFPGPFIWQRDLSGSKCLTTEGECFSRAILGKAQLGNFFPTRWAWAVGNETTGIRDQPQDTEKKELNFEVF